MLVVTITVWFLVLLGPNLTSEHQIIDQFPTKAACDAFKRNLEQMLDQGVLPGARVTDCMPREVVSE